MIRKILILVFIFLALEAHPAVGYQIIEKIVGTFKLSVYLPSGYSASKSYRVLYVNDGQTIFGTHGLNMDGAAEELTSKGLIEPIIIVGIHSDASRTSNYVPYDDTSIAGDFGSYTPSADRYSKKIIQQIIPFIEKEFTTNKLRGIAGYSFGGLHATWMALNYPEQFSFSGSLSPSYWVSDFRIFNEGRKARSNQIYYFDVGTGEWNYYVPMLLHSKLPILTSIFYYENPGGKHVLADWSGDRTKNMLLLFAGKTDLTNYTWDLELEIIRSDYTGKFYPRINPIIRYANGLICSISYAATFSVLNPAAGIVNNDGSFRFTNSSNLNVKVSYNGEEKMITVNYQEVEAIKSGKR